MATEWERHRQAGLSIGFRGRVDALPPHSSQGWEIGSPKMQVDGKHFPLKRGVVQMELVTKPEVSRLSWLGVMPHMLMPGHGGEYAAYGMGFLLGELPAKFKFFSGEPDIKKLIAEYREGSSVEMGFRDGEERQYELKHQRDQMFFAMDFATPGQEDHVARLTMKGRNVGGNPSAYTLDIRYPEQNIDGVNISFSIANGPWSYLSWNPNLLEWIIGHHFYNGHVENPALSALGLSPLIQEKVREVVKKK